MSLRTEENEVKPQALQWNKIGTYIEGTYLGKKDNLKTKIGKNNLYEIRASEGKYWTDNDEEVLVNEGEIIGVWGRNKIFNAQMDRMRLGQRVALEMTELRPSDFAKNPTKIIKVFTDNSVDQAYLDTLDQDKEFELS